MAGKHSPLPWTARRSSVLDNRINEIRDANGFEVNARGFGLSGTEQASANADLMFIAVNAHEALVAAADDALNTLIGCCIPAGGCDDGKTILETQMRLRKVLAACGVSYAGEAE